MAMDREFKWNSYLLNDLMSPDALAKMAGIEVLKKEAKQNEPDKARNSIEIITLKSYIYDITLDYVIDNIEFDVGVTSEHLNELVLENKSMFEDAQPHFFVHASGIIAVMDCEEITPMVLFNVMELLNNMPTEFNNNYHWYFNKGK